MQLRSVVRHILRLKSFDRVGRVAGRCCISSGVSEQVRRVKTANHGLLCCNLPLTTPWYRWRQRGDFLWQVLEFVLPFRCPNDHVSRMSCWSWPNQKKAKKKGRDQKQRARARTRRIKKKHKLSGKARSKVNFSPPRSSAFPARVCASKRLSA